MVPKYYLWYNAQDKTFYENYQSSFDGYAVNAHILAHNAKAFLALQQQHPKPYFILPDLHHLQFYSPEQFDSEKGGMRSSWDKLQQAYPSRVQLVLAEHRPIRPMDLSSANDFDELCSVPLEFQRNALLAPFQSLARLLPADSQPSKPSFLVAPYFYFENPEDPWYFLTIKTTQAATNYKNTDLLYGVVFCSRDCLAPQNTRKLVTDFDIDGIDGYLIGISDFDEHRETETLLDGLKSLVYALSQSGKQVWALTGGHFTSLLSYYGLNGYSSGICTRDKMSARPIPPLKGPAGGPVPRYYIPRLHAKLVQADAQRFLAQFPDFVCHCSLCTSRNIVNMATIFPGTRWTVRQLMREHFLLVRRSQINEIESQSPTASFDAINQAAMIVGHSPLFDAEFLRRWYRVLSGSS
jgi:hypothetical protein